MPNRYGEDPDDNTPFDFLTSGPPAGTDELQRQADRILQGAAIAQCTLCDTDGYRGTTVCDHTDHTQAAHRGMNLIRQTMGWKTPQNPSETQPDPKNRQP
jgi:hypothetical protein